MKSDDIPLGGDPRKKMYDPKDVPPSDAPPLVNTSEPLYPPPPEKPRSGGTWERRSVIIALLIMSIVLFAISFWWNTFEQAVVAWISGWWGIVIGYYFGTTGK